MLTANIIYKNSFILSGLWLLMNERFHFNLWCCAFAHPQLLMYIRGGSIFRKFRRYIVDIDIAVSVSYRHFRYRLFRYIDIVSATSEISVIFQYLSYFFWLFNINLKTNNLYDYKTEFLIWHDDEILLGQRELQ